MTFTQQKSFRMTLNHLSEAVYCVISKPTCFCSSDHVHICCCCWFFFWLPYLWRRFCIRHFSSCMKSVLTPPTSASLPSWRLFIARQHILLSHCLFCPWLYASLRVWTSDRTQVCSFFSFVVLLQHDWLFRWNGRVDVPNKVDSDCVLSGCWNTALCLCLISSLWSDWSVCENGRSLTRVFHGCRCRRRGQRRAVVLFAGQRSDRWWCSWRWVRFF